MRDREPFETASKLRSSPLSASSILGFRSSSIALLAVVRQLEKPTNVRLRSAAERAATAGIEKYACPVEVLDSIKLSTILRTKGSPQNSFTKQGVRIELNKSSLLM